MNNIKHDKFSEVISIQKQYKSALFSKERRLRLKVFIIFFIISKFQSQEIKIYNDSIVTIKISGSGEKKILSEEFYTTPDKVYKDNDLQKGFSYSYTLNKNNVIKLVFSQPLTSCYRMFKNCYYIAEIKFINFDTSQSDNMGSMFLNCKSLKSLDLSSFVTSKVTRFSDMFSGCYAITSIDVSHFNTNKVLNMGHMFGNCRSLISLDLSSFNTFNTNYLDNMFLECNAIKTINFPNFDTTKGKNIAEMFLGCNNLKYLNIKNYKTNNILDSNFFKGTPNNLIISIEKYELISDKNKCITRKFLNNLNDFIKKSNTEGRCIDDCKLSNSLYEYNNKCYKSCISGTYNNNYQCKDCHTSCKECEGRYTSDNSKCIICKLSEKYLNYGNCISNCPRGSYINETTNQKTCKCELNSCLTCSIESLNLGLCTSCENDNGYYPIYDDLNIYNPYLNCSKYPEGYYLDNENSVYKLCYESCKSCNIRGNENEHNCVECKSEYYFETHLNDYKNCYKGCLYYYYFDENKNIFFCTNDFQCPLYYDKLIEDKRECVFNCSENEFYKYEFKNKCYMKCPENSTKRINVTELKEYNINTKYFCKPICIEEYPFEITYLQKCVEKCDIQGIVNESCILNYKENENINIFDLLLEVIEDDFISIDFNSTEIKNGFDKNIKFHQLKVTLTTSLNQKNNENNNNETTVDLKECELKLKEIYNISYNETLFMKKIEIFEEGMMIPKIEFEVYYKLNKTNLIKLNLSYCANDKIYISIPLKLEGNLDIYNPNSRYYNDLCYTTTSDFGTDIILKDRKKEFIEQNKTVCQENCVFSKYDKIIQKVKCLCDIPEISDKFENIKIDKTKLLKNFIDIKNIANINLLVCYKALFTKKGIIKNYGSYSIIFVIIIHFIIIIVYYIKDLFNEIKDKINEISYGIKFRKLIGKKKIENKRKNKMNKSLNEKIKESTKEKYNFNEDKKSKNTKLINFETISNEKSTDNLSNKIKRKFCKNKINIQFNKKIEETENIFKDKINYVENKEILKKIEKIKSYNDEELNDLSYDLALKYDKRKYCDYYISLLKTKHPIFFTFFYNNDYNLKIIKIDLFLVNFVLFFVINTLFFTDDTMHKIYEDKGAFNFIYQLPQVIYSSLISYFFSIPLEMLALTEEAILELKKIKEIKELEKKSNETSYKIKIKFLFYFIISIIFLIFFWYYISVFCAIYSNAQIHLIKDTLLSFASSLIEPFIFFLIPGMFRIPSLMDRKNKLSTLYKLSSFFQAIF